MICMKCQNLFSGKNKKNVMNLLPAEFAKNSLKLHIYPKEGDSLNGMSRTILIVIC